MSDDLLTRATRALRDSHDGASPRSGTTEDRILTVARTRARTGRKVVSFVAAFAALLVLTTAWAATTGHMAGVARWLTGRPPVGAAGPSREPQDVPAPPATTRSPLAAPPEPAPDPSAAAPPHDAPRMDHVSPKATPLAPAVTAPASPAPPTDDGGDAEGALYGVAHHAHFMARDPAQALQAWNAYLDAYPSGRFSLEARYNRALSLVRLGRLDEAHDALDPFASGAAGGYRQREARELLDALGGKEK